MKIAVVAGSHRRDSESLRVAQYIQGVFGTIGVEQTYLLSLSENPLPLWDEGLWSGDEKWKTMSSCGM